MDQAAAPALAGIHWRRPPQPETALRAPLVSTAAFENWLIRTRLPVRRAQGLAEHTLKTATKGRGVNLQQSFAAGAAVTCCGERVAGRVGTWARGRNGWRPPGEGDQAGVINTPLGTRNRM